MKMFAEFFSRWIKNNKNHDKSGYIFYKIIDAIKENEVFLLQCLNTKTTFYVTISEIVFDPSLLYSLHPTQACYIGIEYSKYMKHSNSSTFEKNIRIKKFDKYSVHRYGKYQLISQNRQGNISFINKLNDEVLFMDPRDIALSEELIQEFDAAQAFHIGLLAGLKINNPIKKDDISNKGLNQFFLRIVK